MEGTAEVDTPDWNIPGNPVDILEEVHDDSIVLDREEVGNQVEVVEDKDNQVQKGLDTLEVDMGRVVYSLVADNPPSFLYCPGSSWFGGCYRYRRSQLRKNQIWQDRENQLSKSQVWQVGQNQPSVM